MRQPRWRDVKRPTKWAGAGIGRQVSLKNLWQSTAVRVQVPPRPQI